MRFLSEVKAGSDERLSDLSGAKPFVEGAGGKGHEGTRNLREDCVATLIGRGRVAPICAGVGLPWFGAGA